MTTVCCVCRRIRGEQGWLERRRSQDEGRLSHGYCPECYRQAMAMLRLDQGQYPAVQEVNSLVGRRERACGW